MDYPALIWFQNQRDMLYALLLNEKQEPRFTWEEIFLTGVNATIMNAIGDYDYMCIDEIFTVCKTVKEQREYFRIYKEIILSIDKINTFYDSGDPIIITFHAKGFISVFERMKVMETSDNHRRKFYFSDYILYTSNLIGDIVLKTSGYWDKTDTVVSMEEIIYQPIERQPEKTDYQWKQDKKSKSMLFDLALMIVYSGLVEIPTAHNHEEKEVKFVQDLGRYFGIDFTDAHSKKSALLKTKNKREILSLLENNFDAERKRKQEKELKRKDRMNTP